MAAATWAIRGKAFSDWSDDSMRKSCMPPTLSCGRMATAMTMMPIPPNHCSKARHRRMPGAARSRSVSTVAPVVVIPDMDSNTASVKDRLRSAKAKGRAPKMAMTSQLSVVSRNA